ncbi:ferritin [Neisseria chenwenguii]|uniref:Ferritin n=1 Tax=Neisseria chenwenguii TaxID=1853278 RepID=A0A220S499_9NEIS|nr:non-heme ferritin [Neisseria chenwenguii]ASK28324.1 ferritin [Neisseria chenwenguii]
MLSANVVKLLNQQMNQEMVSSNLYLQMSAWCDSKGYEGAADFLKAHADEEMGHARKLFDYLHETGAAIEVGAIAAPKTEYAGLREVFQEVFEHELEVTAKINALVSATWDEKDYSTFNFLQWYVAEQHEEEHLFRTILEKIDIIGTNGNGLYHVDRDLGQMKG